MPSRILAKWAPGWDVRSQKLGAPEISKNKIFLHMLEGTFGAGIGIARNFDVCLFFYKKLKNVSCEYDRVNG